MFIDIIAAIVAFFSLIVAIGSLIVTYIVYFNNSKGDVVVYTKVDLDRQGLILLVIHNIGKGIAQDITYNGTESIIKNSSGYDIGAFISGTPILFPDEKLIYSLGMYHNLKNTLPDHPIELDIHFRTKIALYPYRRKIKNAVTIDINAFSGVDIGESIFQKDVRTSLKEISSSLKKMS